MNNNIMSQYLAHLVSYPSVLINSMLYSGIKQLSRRTIMTRAEGMVNVRITKMIQAPLYPGYEHEV